MKSLNTQLLSTATSIALSQNSNSAQCDQVSMIDITAVVAGANIANKTATSPGQVSAADDYFIIINHGYTTGALCQLTTSSALPAGLSLATDYYIIVASADTIKFATSQANALAGTAVNITGTGTGTQTVAIVTTLAGTIKLQKNNNPPDMTAVWVDLTNSECNGSNASQTISAAATFNWSVPRLTAREIRVATTITSGTVTADIRAHGKTA